MGPPGTPGTDVSIVLRCRINGKDTVHAYAKGHFVFQECLSYMSNNYSPEDT